MKFGVHMRLLAKPDWKSNYVNYEELKRIVKWGVADGDGNESDASNEGSNLRPAGSKRRRAEGDTPESPEVAVRAFLEAVAAEVKRAEDFYVAQQAECLAQLERAAEVVARAAAVAATAPEHPTAALTRAHDGPEAGGAAASAAAPAHPPAASHPATTPLAEAISAAQAAVGGVSDFLDDLRSFSSLNVTAVRAEGSLAR